MNGIDKAIVDRADDLCLLSARGEDLVAACAKISKSEELDLTIAVSNCNSRSHVIESMLGRYRPLLPRPRSQRHGFPFW